MAPLDIEGPVVPVHRTKQPAVGAGFFGAERLGLLFQQGGEGALGQPGGGGGCDLLHGLEVNVATWARLPEGTASDDFPPLGRQHADFLELLRG